MEKNEVIEKYFPNITEFRGVQEPAIDALIDGENVLCLMPTGGGKSLIYQTAGMVKEKSTLVISPLVALMSQQCTQLVEKGIPAVCFSGMDYRKYYRTLTEIAHGHFPRFIFSSPERISSDGYLEYVLKLRSQDIGLIVVDEVHCVSQWGEGFRPAYRNIPLALNRIFWGNWPSVLCLTATLNDKQQEQIQKEFHITKLIKGENLWRENLHLEIINLKDGKDETKDAELERILNDHRGEKILVFAHRKYGNKGTTRTLAAKYKDSYDGVDHFDSDMSDTDKARVLQGFTDGSIKIVFATSAFGMGIDIEDIRVVVNYLISETVEQYYQEVGRSGRDGKPAYGYLLYTNQSKRGRKMLLNATLCTDRSIKDEWEARKLKPGRNYNFVDYESMNDDQRTAFALLMDYDVVSAISKGVQSLSCFEGVTTTGKQYLAGLLQYSRSGLVNPIVKKTGESINKITLAIWKYCANGDIRVKKAPSKAIFYTIKQELTDEIKEKILSDQEEKKNLRLAAFERFTEGIEAGKTAEQLVREALDI